MGGISKVREKSKLKVKGKPKLGLVRRKKWRRVKLSIQEVYQMYSTTFHTHLRSINTRKFSKSEKK